MALGFQARGANLTWSRLLPRNPLKMWDSNLLSEPPQTCVANPPQKPEVDPLKKNLGVTWGSFLARLMPWVLPKHHYRRQCCVLLNDLFFRLSILREGILR